MKLHKVLLLVILFSACEQDKEQSQINSDSLLIAKRDSIISVTKDSILKSQKQLALKDSLKRVDSIKKVISTKPKKEKTEIDKIVLFNKKGIAKIYLLNFNIAVLRAFHYTDGYAEIIARQYKRYFDVNTLDDAEYIITNMCKEEKYMNATFRIYKSLYPYNSDKYRLYQEISTLDLNEENCKIITDYIWNNY